MILRKTSQGEQHKCKINSITLELHYRLIQIKNIITNRLVKISLNSETLFKNIKYFERILYFENSIFESLGTLTIN